MSRGTHSSQRRCTCACVLAWSLLAFMIAIAGCHEATAKRVSSSDTKVLEKLGNSAVESVGLFKKVGGSDASQIDAALDKVMAEGATVAEKIRVCRETEHGVPAELQLAQPVDVANVEETFGPPGAKATRLYSGTNQQVTFYTYGDLEVGIVDGKVLVVAVNK